MREQLTGVYFDESTGEYVMRHRGEVIARLSQTTSMNDQITQHIIAEWWREQWRAMFSRLRGE